MDREAWEKLHDPMQGLITPGEVHIYLLQTVIAYTAD